MKITPMDRHSFAKQLIAAKLFYKKCFFNFKNNSPTEEIRWTTEAHPTINKEKLETERRVYYGRPDMHEYGNLMVLLKFILKNTLDAVLSDITKLIKILLTTPMTTSEPERCFSTLKRIITFLRSTMSQE